MTVQHNISVDLVPPDSLLFDGSGSKEEFISLGDGFLWNLLVARARLQPSHSVLDIGSGNGQKARPLATYLNSEGRYVGFDVVAEGVEWCKANYEKHPNFHFDHIDLKSDWYNQSAVRSAKDFIFPYEPEQFDVAFMASVVTHLLPAEFENYLTQTFRVLKPGGCLLATCFMVNELNEGKHATEVQGCTFSPYQFEDCWVLDSAAPRRGVAYDEFKFRRLCAQAGFVVAEITYGKWSNSIDKLGALQDSVLLVKNHKQ
jgi:SAM-dependent methyltransferase